MLRERRGQEPRVRKKPARSLVKPRGTSRSSRSAPGLYIVLVTVTVYGLRTLGRKPTGEVPQLMGENVGCSVDGNEAAWKQEEASAARRQGAGGHHCRGESWPGAGLSQEVGFPLCEPPKPGPHAWTHAGSPSTVTVSPPCPPTCEPARVAVPHPSDRVAGSWSGTLGLAAFASWLGVHLCPHCSACHFLPPQGLETVPAVGREGQATYYPALHFSI